LKTRTLPERSATNALDVPGTMAAATGSSRPSSTRVRRRLTSVELRRAEVAGLTVTIGLVFGAAELAVGPVEVDPPRQAGVIAITTSQPTERPGTLDRTDAKSTWCSMRRVVPDSSGPLICVPTHPNAYASDPPSHRDRDQGKPYG
jgi:hypothetical protein